MTTRQLRNEDVARVVEIHREAFPGFLMSRLGPDFVYRYYDLVLTDRGGILLGEEDGNGLIGFVAGFVAPSAFYARLRKARPKLLLSAASHLMIRPHLWGRVLESARLGGAGGIDEGSTAAELASIAVDPKAQGRGCGARLVQRFVAAAGVAGASQVVLTTDASDNDAVNRLYRNNGFEIFHVSTRGNGRTMNHYRRKI